MRRFSSTLFSVAAFLLWSVAGAEGTPVVQSAASSAARSGIQISGQSAATTTVLAVGDIMLGRFVETLAKRYGSNYPFEKIADELRNADMVVGNFEGAIPSKHIPTPKNSYMFSFVSSTGNVLAQNNIRIVSLANNHAFNFGSKGYLNTRSILSEAGVSSFGNPYVVSSTYVLTKSLNGIKMTFVGLDATLPRFQNDKATEPVSLARKENTDSFIVAFVHWGDEYKLSENKAQKTLAHKLVDAGADLVLGAHPHVVEGIERYNGKLIFYSLGNFVFDQYFSKDVQEGLMVEMRFNGSGVAYRLIPLAIAWSQPETMAEGKAAEWLKTLSSRSDPQLRESIQSGALAESKR